METTTTQEQIMAEGERARLFRQGMIEGRELARQELHRALDGEGPARLVSITRSFSYKLNAGNYESRDFFCSQNVECLESEADAKSAAVYEWCKKQVMAAVTAYKEGK